ncbi:MAG: class I SAM-dependent methyltransferase [Patescibacteria group bacterium]|nr:class I SAM-dependent methyltransferase [Patescibacteria group bacterium]
MTSAKKDLLFYYGKNGNYLKDHASFLHLANLKKDVVFLIKSLNLKKKDTILDIACGQGRHANTLIKMGYCVDGVDFSKYLLNLAKKDARKLKLNHFNYYNANVENLNFKKKYTKAYWFFSDLALINLNRAIKNIKNILTPGGLFLFDSDNYIRLIKYLKNNPDAPYIFHRKTMNLIDKKTKKIIVKYYTIPELKKIFAKNKMKILSIYGDYDKSIINSNSKRIIILAENND